MQAMSHRKKESKVPKEVLQVLKGTIPEVIK